MEHFSLWLDGLNLAGQGALHLLFASRLTGKRLRAWHFPAYLSLLGVLWLASSRLALSGILSVGLGVPLLYAVSRFALGAPGPLSWLAAVLAFYISQLSFGILNAIEAAVFPAFIGTSLLYGLLLAAQALFFLLCGLCYWAVGKLLPWEGDGQRPFPGLLLFPSLFFFAAELYILHTAYASLSPSPSPAEAGKQGTLLLLQSLGLAALFCTLYAYCHLCRGFQAQGALQSLAQAVQAQRSYIAGAQARYEQTRAFRHDVKNHLSVLDGLLGGGKLEEGRAYLKKLEAASEALSFPYQTGNPVVDILLAEKLGLAREIPAEVSLLLPEPCAIDDFDLCVLFANALDNAIRACQSSGEPPFLRISGRRQGTFYMLAFENSCPAGPLPPAGTGLSNIRSVAEKYHGAVLTEQAEGRFSLNVLLDISLPPESISSQKH